MSTAYDNVKDATWNEKLAAGLLITGIVIMGVAPFLLTKLIEPGTKEIMNKLTALVIR
jgi:NADH-quinone oxidoreductase subunit M